MADVKVRTPEQRIQHIRERLVNGLDGFRTGDVEALMTAYERVVAERSAVYAELSGLVVRVEAARQRCHDQGESAPGAPETEFAWLIVGDLEAGA